MYPEFNVSLVANAGLACQRRIECGAYVRYTCVGLLHPRFAFRPGPGGGIAATSAAASTILNSDTQQRSVLYLQYTRWCAHRMTPKIPIELIAVESSSDPLVS